MRRSAALLALIGGLSLPLTGCLGAPPQIIRLDPGSGAGSVAATAPITVTFDHPVDRGSVAGRFHLDPPLPGCADLAAAFTAAATAPCRVAWSGDSSSFSLLHPGAPLVPLQHYTASLDAGVTDRGGVVNSLDHRWGFTVAPAPSVVSTSPATGSADVPVDAPLTITFSTSMDPASTAAAIRLSPAVEDTRVLANSRDHSRFVLLPGRLLAPGAAYTVSVDAGARDDRGEPLGAAAASTFTTGTRSTTGHAVVLAGAAGGGETASSVLLTGLGPAQAGDPVASATVLAAPRCAVAACGPVARGGALVGYLAAAGSPDGSTVAVVEHDATAADDQASLHLVHLPDGADSRVAAAGGLPAWSPDARMLAYSGRDGAHVLHLDSGVDQLLPAGDPLVAAPVWSGDGSLLALPVAAPDGGRHVDLASPQLDARYRLPGVGGIGVSVTIPALNPDGTEVAVRQDGVGVSGTWLIGLRTADASPRNLGAGLTPVAYIDAATLVAVERPGDATPVLVRVSTATGDVARIPLGSAAVDLSGVAVDRVRHQIGFIVADPAGVLQATAANADGSNPVPLTTLRPGDGLAAVSVSFGG